MPGTEQLPKAEDEEAGAAGGPLPPRTRPPLRQQIESYFSNEGLKSDRYLHELISGSPGGWVDLDVVLGLRRVKALRAKREDVLRALRDSWLETWRDPDGSSAAVRRPPGRGPLPELSEARSAPGEEEQVSSVQRGAPTPARQAGRRDISTTRPVPGRMAGRSGLKTGTLLFPGRLAGTIAAYDEESGSASIACAQTEALFQKHVCVDWREMEQAGVAVNIGSLVSFLVEVGPGGEPCARELQLRAPEEEDAEDDQIMPPSKRRREAVVSDATTGDVTAAAAVMGNRYTGTIKSFHDGIGIGFLSCMETYTTFGRDVTLDRAELAGFAVGDRVSFVLTADPELGTPKAQELEAAEAEVAASAPPQRHRAPAGPPAKPVPGGRHVGTVRSFNKKRGLGMITCESVQGDVAVAAAELAGFEVGDAVSFLLSKEAPGSYKATELEAEAA